MPTIEEHASDPTHTARHYPVQQWYPVSVALCLLFAPVFGWQLLQGFDGGALFFLFVCLAIAAFQWRAATTRVMLEHDRLTVSVPLGGTQAIEFRQLLDVVQEGRVNPTLLVMYHPRTANGLLALDDVKTVTLPAVQEQAALLDHLGAQVPQ